MTNRQKFIEVFGFDNSFVSSYWNSEYKGEPTIPLSVIEKIKAEIERKRNRIKEVEPQSVTASMSGFVLACSEALAIIDKAVKECTHEED